jgi:hypothetical protein
MFWDEFYAVLFATILTIFWALITFVTYKISKKFSANLMMLTVIIGLVVKFSAILLIFTSLKPLQAFDHHTFAIAVAILIICGTVIEAVILSDKKRLFK